MATPNYDKLVTLVRTWSNRDTEVLNDVIIGDFLRYAADKAYRVLRIPPLEASYVYTVGATQATNSSLPIPTDLTSFIHLRLLEDSIESGLDTQRVYNEKTDVRTYHDMNANKFNNSYWTRQGSNMLIQPPLAVNDRVEIYYYRRLAALRSVYEVTQANIDAGLVTYSTVDRTDTDDTTITDTNTFFRIIDTQRDVDVLDPVFTPAPTTGFWRPLETTNWLRDENERILLMGALAEAFIYLDENDQIQKYAKLFQLEIDEVNKEETFRKASGGNTQMHYISYLI